MADDITLGDIISSSIAFFLLFLGVITNTILIIACCKAKSLRLHVRFLNIQFLFCFILSAIAVAIEIFMKLKPIDNCKVKDFVKMFTGYPRSTGALCIGINAYFVVKKPQIFKRSKNMLMIVYFIIIWFPAIIFAMLNQIFVLTFDEYCLIKTPTYLRTLNHITIIIITCLMIIICAVIVYKICKVEVGDEAFLIVKKKKQIRKVFWFII